MSKSLWEICRRCKSLVEYLVGSLHWRSPCSNWLEPWWDPAAPGTSSPPQALLLYTSGSVSGSLQDNIPTRQLRHEAHFNIKDNQVTILIWSAYGAKSVTCFVLLGLKFVTRKTILYQIWHQGLFTLAFWVWLGFLYRGGVVKSWSHGSCFRAVVMRLAVASPDRPCSASMFSRLVLGKQPCGLPLGKSTHLLPVLSIQLRKREGNEKQMWKCVKTRSKEKLTLFWRSAVTNEE